MRKIILENTSCHLNEWNFAKWGSDYLCGENGCGLSGGEKQRISITRIVVTHTLEETLLRRYDGILVLKNGRIEESGSFEELMKKKGYFYALFTVAQ